MMIAVFGNKEMCRKDVSEFPSGKETFDLDLNQIRVREFIGSKQTQSPEATTEIYPEPGEMFPANPGPFLMDGVCHAHRGNSRPLISRNKNQNNYVPAAIFTTTGSRRSKASFRIPLEVEKQIRRWPAAPWPNQRSAPGTSATRASSRRRSHRCCESSLSSRVQGKFPYVP